MYGRHRRGFPRRERRRLGVRLLLAQLAPAADYDGVLSVEWYRVDDDTKIDDIPISNEEEIGFLDDDDPERRCGRVRARIAEAIAPVNERLATGWRPLARVPVQFPLPWTWEGGPPAPAEPGRRPVDVLYRNGWFIARVQQVKCSSARRRPRGSDRRRASIAGPMGPRIVGLFHDAATGFALAELNYETSNGIGDPTTYSSPIALSGDVVAEAERRAAFVRSWADAGW